MVRRNEACSTARTLFQAVVALAVAVAVLVVPTSPASAATIGGLEPLTYTEGDGAVPIAPNAVITESGSFADGYIEFSIAGATATESLTLPISAQPDPTAGAVSTVGSAVYLGLGGTDFKQIGTIDPVKNGLAGNPLRVNFSAVLPNADFSGGVTGAGGSQTPDGWTINRNHVTLGALAARSQGRPVTTSGSGPYTVTGPGYSFQTDVNYNAAARSQWGNESKERGITGGSFSSDVTSYGGNSRALRLYFDGGCPSPNDTSFCAAFGPEAYSTAFDAKAGDSLAFDWAAANGSDDYEVYGFLVNQDTSVTTPLMYGRGGLQAWSTTSGTIPADGNYRFRFVAGSYDKTGGFAIGASLYIDNVRVLSNDASSAVAQSVTRLVQYENTSDNPLPTRSISVVTATAGGTPATGSVPTAVTPVDDPPAIGAIAVSTFVNTIANDPFATVTGMLPGTDPENDPISYGIDGGTATSTMIGAVTYDWLSIGTYGTLYVQSATGSYAVVPDAAAINARLTADLESFTVTATANGLVGSGSLPIAVSVPASVAGAPTTLGAVGGDSVADLSWVAPTWFGGSSISGYKVERSTDGTNWTTAIADTTSAATTAQVTGLTNGVTYSFRVAALNATGESLPSTIATATPLAVPSEPLDLSATPADRQVALTWTVPVDDGGTPVIGYRIETSPDGATWTVAVVDTGSTSTAASVSGLTNGTPVTFRVTAVNAVGAGAPSAVATAIPRTVPDAPTGLSATPSDGFVTINWNVPDDGGAAITGYRIETSPDGVTWTVAIADTGSTTTAALLGPLTNGVGIHARVAAINVAGTGTVSSSTRATPRTVPGAPSVTAVRPGNRSLQVSFTPPAFNGGSPITNYEYSIDGGATWTPASPVTTAGPITVGKLTNGIPSTVQIRAVNDAGAGPAAVAASTAPVLAPVVPPGATAPPVSNGGGRLLVGDEERPLSIIDVANRPGADAPDGTLRLSGGGVSVDILGVGTDGEPMPLDEQGRLNVVAGSFVQVSGSGYQPGTTVDVWLMPGGILLADVPVDADGNISARVPVPDDVQPGDYTIQMNGVGPDGAIRTISLEVGVLGAEQARTPGSSAVPTTGPLAVPPQWVASPARLAFTGADSRILALLGAILLAGGLVLEQRRRRRFGHT